MEVSIVEEAENEADTIKQQMQRAIDKHLAVPEKRNFSFYHFFNNRKNFKT